MKKAAQKKIVIAYVPVLHDGYRRFFEKSKKSGAKEVFIFGDDIIKKFDHLAKEIRALDPKLTKKAIESWHIFKRVEILSNKNIKKLQTEAFKKRGFGVVMPDEDVSRDVAAEYFGTDGSDEKNTNFHPKITFDPIFLRWDKHNSTAQRPVDVDQTISIQEFDRTVLKNCIDEAEKSSDWWRRIGAAVVKDGEVVMITHNTHVPSPHTPYVNGDPRNNFHKGVNVELSSSLHSEAGLVAEAARRGLSLEGAYLYASTFPCPPCAKQIAYSGIKKLYYTGGYGMLDGADVLKSKGVEIIFVDMGK